MPSIVSTVGSASANSYVTLAEARTYFDARPDADCWLTKNNDEQARALIWATKQLDQMNWLGERVDNTQALAWPRVDVYKPDGLYAYFDSDEIPQQVKDAQCELALQAVTAQSISAASSNGAISSFTDGHVSISYDNTRRSAMSVTTTSEIVDGLLWGLLAGTRLMRA